jgi:hypothetical protein
MPKTKTKRTEYNVVTGMKTKSSIPSEKFKVKKMLERRKKLYNMWKSNKPSESEVRKAFYSDNPTKKDKAILNYPTLDEFISSKDKEVYKKYSK